MVEALTYFTITTLLLVIHSKKDRQSSCFASVFGARASNRFCATASALFFVPKILPCASTFSSYADSPRRVSFLTRFRYSSRRSPSKCIWVLGSKNRKRKPNRTGPKPNQTGPKPDRTETEPNRNRTETETEPDRTETQVSSTNPKLFLIFHRRDV